MVALGSRPGGHQPLCDSRLTPTTAASTPASSEMYMAFHLRTVSEWIQGDHRKRDWVGSFEPQTVYDSDWKKIQSDLEEAREQFLTTMKSLTPESFAKEGAGYGAIAHLAYHLGAIRQLLHDV